MGSSGSIYLFNKNALSLIPNISELAIKIIRSYFNLYNINVEKKIRKKILSRKLRKLSSSKIFISKGEFKHTNNKVIITLYVFNKQKINYLFKLKKRYLNKFLKKILTFKKVNVIDPGEDKLANKYKPKIVKILRKLYEEKKIYKYVAISKYVNSFYKKLIKKAFRKLVVYMYYRQLIYINK